MAMAARTALTATTINSTRKDPRVEARQSNVVLRRFSPPKLDRHLSNRYRVRPLFRTLTQFRARSFPGEYASVGGKQTAFECVAIAVRTWTPQTTADCQPGSADLRLLSSAVLRTR